MRYSICTAIALFVLIAGCDRATLMKVMAPSADVQVAKNYIALLREHKFARIERDIDPEIKVANIHGDLIGMASLIPVGNPESVKIVGSNTFTSPSVYKSNITFEYQFPEKWLLVSVAVQKKAGVSTIIGFNVRNLPDSLENLNRFKLAGRNALQYAVLGGAILIPLLILCALVLCIRTKIPERKWLWIIFIVIGIGQVSVNWTTGQWNVIPLSFQLFGSGAAAPPYGAWILSISFPLGAIWFLVRRKSFSWRRAD